MDCVRCLPTSVGSNAAFYAKKVSIRNLRSSLVERRNEFQQNRVKNNCTHTDELVRRHTGEPEPNNFTVSGNRQQYFRLKVFEKFPGRTENFSNDLGNNYCLEFTNKANRSNLWRAIRLGITQTIANFLDKSLLFGAKRW